MGTSKSYQAPTNPELKLFKGEVTRISNSGAIPSDIAREIIGGYIRVNGGAQKISTGGGIIGGSRASQLVGRKFAVFFESAASQGLERALEELGLSDFIGKSAREISLALIDRLSNDGSTLDDVDARNAISDLFAELMEETETYEQVAEIMEEKLQPEALGSFLFRFFGYYLFQQFCRVFYSRLLTRRGEERSTQFFNSIRDFIISVLKLKTFGKDITKINWAGREGDSILDEVLQHTLEVFGE